MQQPQASASEENKGFEWTAINILRLLTCFIAFLFTVLGFLLQLAGVGSLNNDCDDSFLTKCEDLFREHWWATFFQAAIVVLTLGSVAFNIVKEVFGALGVFLAIATVQLIDSAEEFIDKREFARGNPSENDVDAAAAGYVFSAAGNFLLILVIGISARPRPVMPKMPRAGMFGASKEPIVVQPAVQQMVPQGTSGPPAQQAKVVN